MKRVWALLGIAVLLAVAANAVSPRGLSWSEPLGKDLRAKAALAGLVPVDLGAVRERLKDPRFLFLDARPREEFEIGHLPGAVSLPWGDLEEGRGPAALPPSGRALVVYCANEFCESSLRLGGWLRGKGYGDVALFVEGYEAWWNAGGSRGQD